MLWSGPFVQLTHKASRVTGQLSRYCPSAQFSLLQVVQELAPLNEYMFTEQSVQELAPFDDENLPGGHAVQEFAPLDEEYLPGSHSVQT